MREDDLIRVADVLEAAEYNVDRTDKLQKDPKENEMKRIPLALLTLAGLSVMAGCENMKENDTLIIGGADGPTSIFLSPNASETAVDESLDTDQESSHRITGTWQTASIGYEDNGTMYPEYYVQFTDTEIIYGHMEEDKFVEDHSDRITLYEEKGDSSYRVQAESSNGIQYTYQTSKEDDDMLEYYETWDEAEFPDAYRGGASLSRCPVQETANPKSPIDYIKNENMLFDYYEATIATEGENGYTEYVLYRYDDTQVILAMYNKKDEGNETMDYCFVSTRVLDDCMGLVKKHKMDQWQSGAGLDGKRYVVKYMDGDKLIRISSDDMQEDSDKAFGDISSVLKTEWNDTSINMKSNTQ